MTTTYKYQLDNTELYTAANAACSKVTRVYKNGNCISMLETSEDLTTEEKAAVETAVSSVIRRLDKEGC